jgi:hypothetical protein
MEERPLTLGIHVVVGPDCDAEEVATATLQLRREFLDLDAAVVDVAGVGELPPGARAAEPAVLGALAVTVTQSLLTSVLAVVRSWLASSQRRSIKLELGGDVLELTGLSSDEQRRLTDEWLRRHDSR